MFTFSIHELAQLHTNVEITPMHIIMCAGFDKHSEGLITIIQNGQTHYQKRAYLCIKFMINMCNRSVLRAMQVHVCVRACVRACVRVCVSASV